MDQQLIETRDKLVNLISPLHDENLNTAGVNGGWTVAQVVEHLAVAEVNFLGLVEHAIQQQHIGYAKAKDFSILRDRSVKMKAQHEPSSVRRNAEECIQLLQKSRNKTAAFLNENNQIEQYIVTHPRFGDIPAMSVFTLITEHEHRHIEQIEEILTTIK
ncbi:DinB family protein [Jeotgalibacillus sp. R-1-5s-1]|uniref:DinB family protein n=1 Tax=Jeotgalibacillus sp. R-1-5s-1 TaxID=2555897 RepID=UPI00141B6821|nr:DinB family protein [Jeotgalibacillus sp. R-1-5s-1]